MTRNPLLHHTGQRLHLSEHRRSGLDRQVDEESPDDRAPRHAEAARQRAALDIPQVRSALDDECRCAGQKNSCKVNITLSIPSIDMHCRLTELAASKLVTNSTLSPV